MAETDNTILKYADIWEELTLTERAIIKALSAQDLSREQLCTFLNSLDKSGTWTTRSVKLFIEHLIYNKRVPIGFHTTRGLFLIKNHNDKSMAMAACLKMARTLIERANFTEKVYAERENLLPFETYYHDITIKGGE